MICIHVGCRLRRLYTIGKMATIPCGGALMESLDSRFRNDAIRLAGRYLLQYPQKIYVDDRNKSDNRRNRARYRVWNNVGVKRAYNLM
jgi:hypothetical protein